MATKRLKGKLPPFIPATRTTIASPAWKALSFGARAVYVDLRGYLRHDNANNGKVYRSYRDVRSDLGRGTLRSIGRWYRELAHYGFIVQTSGFHLGLDGDGVAPHWRLTECPSFDAKGNMVAATREFEKWDGSIFVDPEKTESCTPQGYTPYPSGLHTGEPERDEIAPNCIPEGYIDSPPNCIPEGYITCCHSSTPLKPYRGVSRYPTPITDAVGARLRYPRAAPTQPYTGYSSLPIELRMLALGLRAA